MQDLLRKMLLIFISIGTLVSVALGAKALYPRYTAWQANRAERDILQVQVAEAREEITNVKRKMNRFQTSPYFVEQLARANHRVADNEIVYIFE